MFLLNGISNIIGNEFPGLGSILLDQLFQYKKAVYIDDKIEILIQVIDKIKYSNRYVLKIICTNQNHESVLEGTTKVK